MLQNEEAILLPDLYATFCEGVVQTIDMFPNVTKEIKTNPPTIRWLLVQLVIT